MASNDLVDLTRPALVFKVKIYGNGFKHERLISKVQYIDLNKSVYKNVSARKTFPIGTVLPV